ncbi:MAG: outer membrane protein transport protein [Kofleriaceae bacterium]
MAKHWTTPLFVSSILAWSTAANAGGLFLPGTGAVSTSRAGASTASTDNPEALLLNPARLTEVSGTQIMIGVSLIDFSLSFDRLGSYDPIEGRDLSWEGQDHPTVSDSSTPPVGLGPYQAIPMIAVSSDLGGRVRGLTLAGGLWAPQSYPTRDISSDYRIDDPVNPPPPSRYDIMEQEATFLIGAIGAGYRVLPQLDVGARVQVGRGKTRARTFLWGLPNFAEYTGSDAELDLEAEDNFMPSFGLGVSYRLTPKIELAAQYHGQFSFVGKGTAKARLSQYLSLSGVPAQLTATPDAEARCAKGGTDDVLRSCVDLTLPMSASIAGRYKFLDAQGRERGDVELDLGWENWGQERAADFLVVVDAQVNGVITLKDGLIRHGFRDTFAARLGGSYRPMLGGQDVVVRGGLSYDTAAAKPGWERLDFDGAARTTLALGASWRTRRVQVDLGAGAILEGTRDVGKACNPDIGNLGCDGTGQEAPIDERTGADPINPLFQPFAQNENPINHGRYSSHYVLLMAGVTALF